MAWLWLTEAHKNCPGCPVQGIPLRPERGKTHIQAWCTLWGPMSHIPLQPHIRSPGLYADTFTWAQPSQNSGAHQCHLHPASAPCSGQISSPQGKTQAVSTASAHGVLHCTSGVLFSVWLGSQSQKNTQKWKRKITQECVILMRVVVWDFLFVCNNCPKGIEKGDFLMED